LKGFLSDAEISDRVHEDIKWSRDYRKERTDDWLRLFRLYKNYIDQATYPWDANNAIPTANTTVEVQVAYILDMIFETGDFVEVLGKTPQGQVHANAIKEMLNYHFRHSFHTYEDMEKFIRQLLMFGTSIYKVFWDYREEWKTRHLPRYENGLLQELKQTMATEIASNKPGGYVVDLWNFGFDPNGDCLDNCRYCFEDMWLDASTLLERQQMGIYKNIDALLETSADDFDVNEGLKERMDEIAIESFQNSPYVERGKVHVVEYWGKVASGWKGGKLSKSSKSQVIHVILAIGSSARTTRGKPIVLLSEPSPFHHNKFPYVDVRLNACVGEFYGTGDLEICESLFVEQRDLRNIFQDNLNRTINRMFLMRDGADINEDELEHAPGGVIHVPNLDTDLKIVDYPPIDAAYFKAQDDIRRDIEMATGVNDFVMGQYRSATGFNDTASGISMIQNSALKRVGQKGQVVQRGIKNIAFQAFALIAQYQPYGITVRILERENAMKWRFIDISPRALQEEYDFYAVSAPSVGSKPMRQQQLIQLLQILTQLMQQGGPQLDMGAFARRVLEEMDIPNPQEFLGFPSFNQPLPNLEVQERGETEYGLAPEEENRVMIDNLRPVMARMGENHPQHILVHNEGFDTAEQADAKSLLADHVKIHHGLMEQERAILATTQATQMQAQQVQQTQQAQQAQPQQVGNQNFLSGGNTKSQGPATGVEDFLRGMANTGAGNV
jgi:hypothetical protein